jgi:hypothetical protein
MRIIFLIVAVCPAYGAGSKKKVDRHYLENKNAIIKREMKGQK